ncbi:GlsB/YeaQ/YmgE family stress response membrane protein [Microbulbifer pacificus]|uniref:GlsB/YeaQ/YmgE family stress response membrane protein n=1 Tax=Microbulbifer pacificus TaxID=407164 RepID=UPI000CF4F536|nr:GlsB/YeaQ/YmgE family stress response membrane protein [Microbulbifer pacificus]
MEDVIYILIVGAVAGWLASLVVARRGLGVVGNIVVGVLGAYLGSWITKVLDVSLGSGLVGEILHAFMGALLLLLLIGLVKRK